MTPEQEAYQKNVLEQALRYYQLGLSIFPLEYKSKRPFFEKLPLIEDKRKWEPFGESRADEKQLRDWFSSDLCNIAVIQGAVSGNLVVMDFDEEPVGIPLAEYVMGETLENLGAKTIVVKTKKGTHVYLRTDAPVQYEKFDKLKPPVLMEIRADVHYVVAPPSIHPDSGQPYSFIGPANEIMTVRTEQYQKWRADLTEKLEEWPYVREIIPYWKAPGRNNVCLGVAAFFRKVLEWPEERAEKVVRGICLITRDEEESSRINAVKGTYKKDDLETVGTQKWLGEDLFNVLKGVPRPDKKKGKGKPKDKQKEDEKMTAFRINGNHIYRQVIDEGVPKFAKYDRQKKELLGYVDKTDITGEIPIPLSKSQSVMFPRRLVSYGTPAELYQRVKKKVRFASDQKGHKMDILALYLMYHGCVPPFERKNFQIIAMGQPASGKSRIGELAKLLGDRARINVSLKNATAYRVNDMLGGGLLIIDETPKDNEELEMLIRGRWDPDFFVERIIDPHDPTAIMCFRMSGPTIIILREPYTDDANTDRGIIIACEKGEEFPMELLEATREQYHELLDMLAMFWTEHYNDPRLLPNQDELWYRKGEKLDPRLKLMVVYLNKLAQVISAEAVADLDGFANEQVTQRIRMKSTTPAGQAVRAFYDILLELKEGRSYSKNLKSGESVKMKDELAIDFRGNRVIPYINRTTVDEGSTKVVGLGWQMIADRMQTATRQEPGKILQQYSVEVIRVRVGNAVVRTLAFQIDSLDRGFRTFIDPDQFDEHWANFAQKGEQPMPKGQQVLVQEPSVPQPSVTFTIDVPLAPLEQQMDQSYEEFKAEFDTMLKGISDKGCDSELAEWAIGLMSDRMKEGDRTSAYLLRSEAKRRFPDRAEELTEVVDRLFADFEKAARLVFKARNLRQTAK